ncbi:MAG: hypothetical protein WA667_06705 [Candidatus Nitrosopolaris sp.]
MTFLDTCRRRDNLLLDSVYYSTQVWGALNDCWKGFKIAKSEWDMKNMFYYGIRRLQRELEDLYKNSHSLEYY